MVVPKDSFDKTGIFIKYTCKRCRTYRQPVHVRFRGPDEDVAHYVREVVAWAVGRDHRKRAPGCTATTMDEIMIPLTNEDGIGFKPKLEEQEMTTPEESTRQVTNEQLAEWRRLAENTQMVSVVGEYTPREFVLLLDEVERLRRGEFTEEEFQNLCHNMTVDGQPVTAETVCRFKRGCEEYQKKLFGGLVTAQPSSQERGDR